jgi:hypothetical protein
MQKSLYKYETSDQEVTRMGSLSRIAFCTVLVLAGLACQEHSEDQVQMVLGDVIDPEAYRAEIQSLENDIYAPEFDANVRSALTLKLNHLASEVEQNQGVFTKMFCVEMRQLGRAAQLGSNERYIRENWERIRCGVFADAAWYRWRHAPERPQAASHAQ